MSGARPTGRQHLGNLVGALAQWVALAQQGEAFFEVADWHALTTAYEHPQAIRTDTTEMVLDWLAAGVDPARSTLYVQSRIPQIAELHLLLSMIVPLGWLQRAPTFKDQIEALGHEVATYGFLGYPLLQLVDIAIVRADTVPVGKDQLSHLEVGREIVRRFNNFYGNVFPEPQPLFTATPKVPGLDGRKMSKSYGNTIGLTASADEIRALVMTMFTDPNRIRRKDPGNPDICNRFQFHKLFSEDATIARVDHECRTAQIGCVDDKKLLAEIMIEQLRPVRARREEIDRDPGIVWNVLREGNERARERAAETLTLVRRAMKIEYPELK